MSVLRMTWREGLTCSRWSVHEKIPEESVVLLGEPRGDGDLSQTGFQDRVENDALQGILRFGEEQPANGQHRRTKCREEVVPRGFPNQRRFAQTRIDVFHRGLSGTPRRVNAEGE